MNEKLLQMARSVVGSEHQMLCTGELFVFCEDQLARFAELVRADDKRDAERYRWLRGRHWTDGGICVVGNAKLVKLGAYCPCGDGLDGAIDSAMQAHEDARGKQEKV